MVSIPGRGRALFRLAAEMRFAVQVADMSAHDWLLRDTLQHCFRAPDKRVVATDFCDHIIAAENSRIGSEMQCHNACLEAGSSTLRTFTEYLSPLLFSNRGGRMKQQPSLDRTLMSSVNTLFHTLQKNSGGIKGIVNGHRPVASAATIGKLELPLTPAQSLLIGSAEDSHLWRDELSEAEISNAYSRSLQVMAPHCDVIWIQNITQLSVLKLAYNAALGHKDADQIWVSIDSDSLMAKENIGAELGELFGLLPESSKCSSSESILSEVSGLSSGSGTLPIRRAPAAVIATGRNPSALNSCVATLLGAAEAWQSPATQIGAIVDSKQSADMKAAIGDSVEIDAKSAHSPTVAEFVKCSKDSMKTECDTLWHAATADCEWTDAQLADVSAFWMAQGVSVVGCGWLSGIKALRKVADAANSGL